MKTGGMKTGMTFGAAGLALALALGGCGGGESQGGLSAQEEQQLNEAAAMLEENVFDTSADSLVADPAELENGEAAENAAEGNAQ